MLPGIFAGVTFVMVFGIILGLYWTAIVRAENLETTRLRSRFGVAAMAMASPSKSSALLRADIPLSEIPGLNALLARSKIFVTSLRVLIERSRVRTTVGAVVLGSATLFFAAFGLTVWLLGLASLGIALGVCVAAVPTLLLQMIRQRLVRKFEDQLPEAMDLISRSLRAGHAFATGLKLAGEELPDPMGAEFRALHDRHSFGQPMPLALREFADRVELIDARFFVTAVLTQREAGGNLAEVLDHLSSVVRDRFRIKREVQTKSAHGRMSGYVIAAMPPALFLYTWISSPERFLNFVNEPMGRNLLVGAFVLQVVGTLIIRKIVNIRY